MPAAPGYFPQRWFATELIPLNLPATGKAATKSGKFFPKMQEFPT
jgi:hypothetical protein